MTGNVVDHGSEGYEFDGFLNVPITSFAAIRLVAFDEHDAGFIDNVPGTRLRSARRRDPKGQRVVRQEQLQPR